MFLLHMEWKFALADHITAHGAWDFVMNLVYMSLEQHGTSEHLVTFRTWNLGVAVYTLHVIGQTENGYTAFLTDFFLWCVTFSTLGQWFA